MQVFVCHIFLFLIVFVLIKGHIKFFKTTLIKENISEPERSLALKGFDLRIRRGDMQITLFSMICAESILNTGKPLWSEYI